MRPYGPVGLVVSTLVILLTAGLLAGVLASIGFATAAAVEGWRAALASLGELLPSADLNEQAADHINIIFGAFAYAVTTAAVVIVARFRGGPKWVDLVGWHSWNMARSGRMMILLLLATLGYSLLASTIIEHVYPASKDWVSAPSGTPWIVAFLALATLFAPITEELLFRGWIFTSLRSMIGARFAILAAAALFALAHWEPTHLYALAVFPVGLALGYVRQRTDSVAASITFHSLYNGVAAVLMFVAK